MTECCPCIKYRERGQSRERRAPVRGPGPVGPPVMGVGPSGSPRPGCPASRGIGGTSFGVLGPGAPAGAAPGHCAALRCPPPGFGPPRLSPPSLLRGGWRWSAGLGRAGSPLRSLWVAPVASGYRRPACARRPVPRAPPRPVPCASCGPRAPGAGPWWGESALACSVLPAVALRGSAASPSPLWPLAGPPCAPPPAGAALRASGLLPPGGAGRALRARLSASAPPGVGKCHRQASPARVKPGGQRPPLPGRPACGMWALSPQKGA